MRTPDHHEFARLLKITDAPDGYNIIPLVVEEDDRLDAFTNSVLMEASDDDLRPFWSRLTASYLPQLVQTEIKCPLDYPPRSVTEIGRKFRDPDGPLRTIPGYDLDCMSYQWGWWMDSILRSIQVNRFVREQPKQAIAFHQHLLESICKLPFHQLSKLRNFDGTKLYLSQWIFLNWSTMHDHLMNYLPSAFPFPQPTKQTRHKLRLLSSAVLVIGQGIGLEPSDLSRIALERFVDVFGAKQDHLPLVGRALRVHWWACEATVRISITLPPSDDSDCAQAPRGSPDMPACSRCGAVRYCSTAHQLAHWPTHKLVCVRPRW